MFMVRSKAQVSKSEHKLDCNAMSVSNTASTLEFPNQAFIDPSIVLLHTSKQTVSTSQASYFIVKMQLAYTYAYMRDKLCTQMWPKYHDKLEGILPAESTAPHEGDVVSTRYMKKLTRKQASSEAVHVQETRQMSRCMCVYARTNVSCKFEYQTPLSPPQTRSKLWSHKMLLRLSKYPAS
jgi:hypothetical protein